MPDDTSPMDTDFEQASSRLAEGLESCRSMVKSYQTMLGGAAEGSDTEAQDASGGNISD